jgi:hypothetical protein
MQMMMMSMMGQFRVAHPNSGQNNSGRHLNGVEGNDNTE